MLTKIRLLLLALWLGAAIFFSATVAPAAFSVLRGYQLVNAGELAGSIVTRALSAVNTAGFVIAVLLLITALLFNRPATKIAFYVEAVLLVLIAAATGVSQWVISPKMIVLRRSLFVPIDEVARDHPGRVAFDTLHGYSVTLLLVAMLASLITFFLIARRRQPN